MTLLRDDVKPRWPRYAIKIAQQVAKGELRPDLVAFAAETNRIMHLTEHDQNRIASDEQFHLYAHDGSVCSKAWGDMDTKERSRLIGGKGATSWIRSLTEQKDEVKKPKGMTISTFERACLHDDMLQLSAPGGQEGRIELFLLRESLTREQCDHLVAYLLEGGD